MSPALSPRLANYQARLRHAMVARNAAGVVPLLVGGLDPGTRLAVHQRHYDTSLVTTLIGKFPATVWLVGTPLFTDAARAFVHERPPSAPCLAEYGEDFPDFLSSRVASPLAYLRAFARLEWCLGLAAVAIDHPPVSLDEFSWRDAEELMDVQLSLQPGLYYLQAEWPVDELMKLFLTETAPDRFVLDRTDVWIEVRGARGTFDMRRLDRGHFAFRRAIQEGLSLGEAAESVLSAVDDFDAGAALQQVVGEGLVVAMTNDVRAGAK
ncbi:MAG: HvfC/BufC family peptide modification chaperone [Vicinamibacteraceae bacterium]